MGMSGNLGRRRPVLVVLLSFMLLACGASVAHAAIGANDLVVTTGLSATWVSGGSKPITVLSQPTDGTNRLVIDVTVDGTSLAHVDCSCKVYGDAHTSGGTTTYTAKQIAAYDTSALADGSAHTLVVKLTKYPTGESTSKTYTFNVDRTPPTPDPDGALVWVQGGFIGPTGGPVNQYGLTVGGIDDLSGIAKVGWVESDAHQSIRPGSVTICTADPCPKQVAQDTNVTLYEGVHWLYATATDRAGNVAQTSKWTVQVDKTGPRAPTGLAALRDPETGETFLVWDDGGDPLLTDTTVPSGTASYKYRYKVGAGAWTAVTPSDDDFASIGTQTAGAPVTLEVTPVDAAGNVGTTASATPTITDSADLPFDIQLSETEPSTTAAPQTLAAPGPKSVRCAGFGYQGEPTIDALGGESGIALNTSLSGYCWPVDPANAKHLAVLAATTLTLKVCIQVQGATGYRDIKCVSDKKKAPTPATQLKVSAAQLCRPGTQQYRLNIRATVKAPGFRPDSKLQPSNSVSRPCNEAGVWRRIASYASSPGQTLGRALKASGTYQDKQPAGDSSLGGQEGWEAHHIVPAGEGTTVEGPDNDNYAERAQRYAYDCGIEPNTAVNGVWLRGLDLVEGKPGYNKLDADAKRRAKHRGPGGAHGADRRDQYYTYVGNRLSAYVNDATDACSSPAGAQSALQAIRALLISGFVPTA
jgi:hypothetical protein